MKREEIIQGLQLTIGMFLFNPFTDTRNNMNKTIIDACRGAIALLEQEPIKDEVILTKKEYEELVSSEYHAFDNGYAEGIRAALEQEPILDEIKKEIKKEIMYWQIDIYDNEYNAEKHDFVFERIYEIIDKYRTGSEE